jgi:hypothetical protein
MPGRTWVIAPDADSLKRRWDKLMHAPKDEMEELFQPHQVRGQLADRHVMKKVSKGLHGHEPRTQAVGDDKGPCVKPVRYAFRSFDRQWIIPDNRLINRPNPQLWEWHSDQQVYLTAPSDRSPTGGPAITFTAIVPDLHHYHGRGGRVFPLWKEGEASEPNVWTALLSVLSGRYGRRVSEEELMAYLAGVAAHPAFTARFQADLVQPGLRIPLTADAALFDEAAQIGRRVIWLHTFGERFSSPKEGRPKGPPRLPKDRAPRIPAKGAIPDSPDMMPEAIDYDASQQRLLIGGGYVELVPPAVWNYEVSGKHVVRQWFSYRQKDRSRPIMGDRRPPSKLTEIQPDHWLAEYTTELIDLLNVLGLLVELEPQQSQLLDRICDGPLISIPELNGSEALESPRRRATRKPARGQRTLPEEPF